MWFQRHEEPKAITDEYEQVWCKCSGLKSLLFTLLQLCKAKILAFSRERIFTLIMRNGCNERKMGLRSSTDILKIRICLDLKSMANPSNEGQSTASVYSRDPKTPSLFHIPNLTSCDRGYADSLLLCYNCKVLHSFPPDRDFNRRMRTWLYLMPSKIGFS